MFPNDATPPVKDHVLIFYGFVYFVIAQLLIWLQANLQLASEWWADKPLVTALIFSVPISLFVWWGTRYSYYGLGDSAWGSRFLAFGASYVVFPIMTWVWLHESPFTMKTMVCIVLSIIIVCVQAFG